MSARAQIERLGDVVAYAVECGARVSIDTTEPEVAAFALGQGASMVNSVSLAPAHELGAVAAEHGAELVLMHARGSMTSMAGFSEHPDDDYRDVVAEVADEWLAAADRARAAGVPDDRLLFDPGFGFQKNASQSLELCLRLGELKERVSGSTPRRVLAGPGRKSYLAKVVAQIDGGAPPAAAERLGATVAASLWCADAGADVLRVHDVVEVGQALTYWQASRQARALLDGAAARIDGATARGGADA